MNIQDLIDILEGVEDKEMKVFIPFDFKNSDQYHFQEPYTEILENDETIEVWAGMYSDQDEYRIIQGEKIFLIR